MSWEVIRRTRSSTEIHCPDCRKKAVEEARERQRVEEKDEALYEKAKTLAIDRYMGQWLALYTDLSTKAAWQRYTGGSGYPALGTFCKHVKHAGGVPKYMQWTFESDFEDALRKMAIEDKDIHNLLFQRSNA